MTIKDKYLNSQYLEIEYRNRGDWGYSQETSASMARRGDAEDAKEFEEQNTHRSAGRDLNWHGARLTRGRSDLNENKKDSTSITGRRSRRTSRKRKSEANGGHQLVSTLSTSKSRVK